MTLPRPSVLLAVLVLPVSIAAAGSPASAASRAGPPAAGSVVAISAASGTDDAPARVPRWSWPIASPRIVSAYLQPPHPYAAGHRGIDLAGGGDTVSAPDDGVVAFAGVVVDRPVLTIDHGDGWVSSFEPVTTTLRPGEVVARGDPVGLIAAGGHAAAGTLHIGARHDGAYVNPLLLLGGLPRAVLLPCC